MKNLKLDSTISEIRSYVMFWAQKRRASFGLSKALKMAWQDAKEVIADLKRKVSVGRVFKKIEKALTIMLKKIEVVKSSDCLLGAWTSFLYKGEEIVTFCENDEASFAVENGKIIINKYHQTAENGLIEKLYEKLSTVHGNIQQLTF